jgi:hydroxymethylpyrimidine/phosphomethylpyrimidine kinase
MLATAANVAMVAEFLEMLRAAGRRVPVVLDPVLRSSSGRELLDAEGVSVLRRRLLPLVDWVTPNLEEAGVLTGQMVTRREEMLDAARVLQAMGVELNVVVTGGHMDPPDDLVVFADGEVAWLPGERIESRATHGTGCAFSSALLSRAVLGDSAMDAAVMAKQYVTEAIRTAEAIGKGRGPVNHLWPLRDD